MRLHGLLRLHVLVQLLVRAFQILGRKEGRTEDGRTEDGRKEEYIEMKGVHVNRKRGKEGGKEGEEERGKRGGREEERKK